MKKVIFTLGLALTLFACSTEEFVDNVQTSTDAADKAAAEQSLDRTISVVDPITIGADDFIEQGLYVQNFLRPDGTRINTSSQSRGRFTRGHMTIFFPSVSGTRVRAFKFNNGGWEFVASLNDFIAGGTTAALGLVQNLNRWYEIDGEFYFLSSSFRNGGVARWFRAIPGQPLNTGNMQEVSFTNREPSVVAALNDFDEELRTLVKKNIITASSDENEDLGFFFASFENTIPSILPEGYENLFIKVNARTFGGAEIKDVKLFINGQLLRTERFSPYEWGAVGQRPDETLNLPSATFGTVHTIRAQAEDTEGRIVRTGKVSIRVDRRIAFNLE